MKVDNYNLIFPTLVVTLSNCTHVKINLEREVDFAIFAIYNNPLTPSRSCSNWLKDQKKIAEVSNVYIHNKSFTFWVKQEQSW